MLTVYANMLGTFLIAPMALQGRGCGGLLDHWRSLLLVAALAGFERNLTNSSMYKIGGSLKTALHGFNVVVTLLVSALLGADDLARKFVCSCRFGDNIALVGSVALISSGGVVTAFSGTFGHGTKVDWHGSGIGITLQLMSGLAYACKFSAVKLLLGHGTKSAVNGGDSADKVPSKVQIVFASNLVTGISALAFLPFFETSWAAPSWSAIVTTAAGATGILIFELRLTELTSPLTVSVLGAFHNVVIVLFFVLWDKERLTSAQTAGFIVSSVGVLSYSRVKHAPKLPSRSSIDREIDDCGDGLAVPTFSRGLVCRKTNARGEQLGELMQV